MTPIGFAFLCQVLSVHDGDTFTCDSGLIVRLWGAAAVELKEPGGIAERDWLSQHVVGRRLVCDLKGTSFGRLVSQCTLEGQDVAAAAVSAGAAADCPLFSKGFYAHLEGPQTLHVAACGPPVLATKTPPQ